MADCIIDNCKRKAVVRGVCNNCYQGMTYYVQRGRTTWDFLLRHGFVLQRAKFHRKAKTVFTRQLSITEQMVDVVKKKELRAQYSLYKEAKVFKCPKPKN